MLSAANASVSNDAINNNPKGTLMARADAIALPKPCGNARQAREKVLWRKAFEGEE